ncbi:MAG: imidazole glycerol phosphate synthase subunit HisH [Actinomycetota bacterium]|nr:imidazole glycerol phosphate synthase subunit HisH [Actinomycetota bacterium]
MSQPVIAVLDYGIGNLRSAEKALQKVGGDARLTRDPAFVASADAVVLPGVGAFGACMDALRGAGLEDVVYGAVDSGRPFLGICVGMQMLFTSSQEDLDARGLDIISGTVKWIPTGVKRPQMQWNKLSFTQPDDAMFEGDLLRDASNGSWVYFVHSLHGVPMDPSLVAATCGYGVTLNAAFRQDNVFATQFHPEKSGASGLALLDNFVKAAGAS